MAKSEFVKATYLGGKYVHPVNTPTGVLFHKHNRADYGLHQRGDQFDVLLVDVKARPDLFAVVVEDEEPPKPVENPPNPNGETENPPPNDEGEDGEAEDGGDENATAESGEQAPSDVPPKPTARGGKGTKK